MMINPNIGIVTGSVPTSYGEVESAGSKEKSTLDKLDQVSARVLCYTDKCFSMFAQSDKIHFKFYQRDDNCSVCQDTLLPPFTSVLVNPWGMMVPPTEGSIESLKI